MTEPHWTPICTCGLANPADDPAALELGSCRECGYPPEYWHTGPELPVVYVNDRDVVRTLRKQLEGVCYVEFDLRPGDILHIDLSDVPNGTILPGLASLTDELRERRLGGLNVTTFYDPEGRDHRPAWKSPYDRRYGK